MPSFPGRGVTKFHAGYPRTAFLGGIPFRRFLSRKPQQAQRLFIDLLYRGVTEEERAILARVFDRIGKNVQEVLEHAD